MFSYEVKDNDGIETLGEAEMFDSYEALVANLSDTADLEYTDKVTTWAVSTDTTPLRIRNGSTIDVWKKN